MNQILVRFLGTLLVLISLCTGASGEPLLVSAAASLTDALKEIAAAYQRANPGSEITYNFGGSGALQKQIENGAPVDVFIAAAAAPMDVLEKQELLRPQTRRDLLTNTLVLVAQKDRHDLSSFNDLAIDQVKHIAIGEPRTVPAGIYAMECLTALKLVPRVEPKLVRLLNVRQVLAAVETGNADAGLVYRTDATSSPKVRIVATPPEDSYEKILYPGAVVGRSKQPDKARNYLAFLQSETARAIFERYGFVPAK